MSAGTGDWAKTGGGAAADHCAALALVGFVFGLVFAGGAHRRS